MLNRLFTIQFDANYAAKPNNNVYDVSVDNVPELREFNAFRSYCASKEYLKYDYSGLVSPKFTSKTGLGIEEALMCVEEGVDAVLFHPYPRELLLQDNFMQLAELEHPGITDGLRDLWRKLFNEDLPLVSLPENKLYCCHCNYFIANKKFWSAFGEVVDKIDGLYMSGDLNSYIHGFVPYSLSDGDASAPHFPFIFERFLTHYLYKHKNSFSVKNVAYEKCFNAIPLFKYEPTLISVLKNALFLDLNLFRKSRTNISTLFYYLIRKQIFKVKRSAT